MCYRTICIWVTVRFRVTKTDSYVRRDQFLDLFWPQKQYNGHWPKTLYFWEKLFYKEARIDSSFSQIPIDFLWRCDLFLTWGNNKKVYNSTISVVPTLSTYSVSNLVMTLQLNWEKISKNIVKDSKVISPSFLIFFLS